ncbi:MAG: hypothetical protein K0Q73_6487 [Paenibacillus sp.]|jgi:hypothetical protein|nr:hypothetical protein [Paenibacillus sp.]
MDIIISAVTQRTGSTLVQRIFNARKQTLIWGEHGGIISEFLRIGVLAGYFSEHGKPEKDAFFKGGKDTTTWIANMSPDYEYIDNGIIQSVKTLLQVMYSEYREHHDRIGFKEVRYGKQELQLLKRCYPDAIVVLLVRNPIHIWKSETIYWAGEVKQFCKAWNERTLEYGELQNPDEGIYLLRYEDIVERDEKTLQLLSELADVQLEAINNVLRIHLNSTSKERSIEDMETIRSNCQQGMELLRYLG